MGTYLNPGNERFLEATRSEIYVDKTEMILFLNKVINTEQKYISISRPRRFGKSMSANMICAYYDKSIDSRSIFQAYKIAETENWDQYMNQLDVLKLNMIDFLTGSEGIDDMLSYLNEEVTDELREEYPDVKYGKRINLRTVMNKIYSQKGKKFVIIIDEWDCVFRELAGEEYAKEHKAYLDFLRDWLKDKEYVALAYITGILPIKKYGKHSALNMFHEFSMTSCMQLAKYVGFTDDEVRDLCCRYGRDFEDCRKWYDGYMLNDIIPPNPNYQKQSQNDKEALPQTYHIYNPLSVVKNVTSGIIENYWNETETYEALEKYISRNYGGLREFVTILMKGERRPVDISSYQNDMTTFHSRDDVLTLLIHLGYLGYDSRKKEVFIPNKEIEAVFRSSTKGKEWGIYSKHLNNHRSC